MRMPRCRPPRLPVSLLCDISERPPQATFTRQAAAAPPSRRSVNPRERTAGVHSRGGCASMCPPGIRRANRTTRTFKNEDLIAQDVRVRRNPTAVADTGQSKWLALSRRSFAIEHSSLDTC